jgi:hypothetical protein
MVMLADLRDDDGTFSLKRFRLMILASLRKNILKFRKEFGYDIVLAIDSGRSWRKDYFAHYKASRQKNRDASGIDWTAIFAAMRTVKEELKEHFPYRVVEAQSAEADDVISTLVHEFGSPLASENNKILILSGDKDYVQLQKFGNVFQYDPTKDKKITTPDPELYLIEHIIKGDKSDGVPNMLSPDDIFVRDGGRQTTISAKRLKHYTDLIYVDSCDEVGYFRNRLLIDLSKVPNDLKINIMKNFETEAGKGRNKILNYFIKYRITNQMQNVMDF